MAYFFLKEGNFLQNGMLKFAFTLSYSSGVLNQNSKFMKFTLL